LLPKCLPTASAVWFSNEELPAGFLAAEWLERGTCTAIGIRSAQAVPNPDNQEVLMTITIGIDPHKATHTAVAIDRDETELATITVRATRRQTERLLGWAEPFGQRIWAIESAGGLGYLLAQQLVDAGEHVLDVPATLASRVRVLGTGKSDKNDPNDARSVAIAAMRAPGLRSVQSADHAEVLRLLAKRNQDLGDLRTKLVCRLHNVIASLSPGGIAKELNASDADAVLGAFEPSTPVEHVRHQLALELLEDVRRLDGQLKESHRRIKTAVAASGTSLTEVYGIGPVLACALIGYTGDVRRFANRDQFAAYNGTAPIEVLGWPGGPPTVATRQPATQSRHPHGGHLPDPSAALRGPCLLRTQGRRGKDQEGSDPFAQAADLEHRLPAAAPRLAAIEGPGGQVGNDSKPAWSALHPEGRLFGEVTPGPPRSLCSCAVG
jgi:transposase